MKNYHYHEELRAVYIEVLVRNAELSLDPGFLLKVFHYYGRVSCGWSMYLVSEDKLK